MMFALPTLIGFALFCQAITACEDSNKTVIKVDVYYESLCPDSINFIQYQLTPNYEAFKDHLNVNFIPYGKARYTRSPDGKLSFSCQHGQDECNGNRVQACAINELSKFASPSEEERQRRIVKFVGCYMEKNAYVGQENAVNECAEAGQLDSDQQSRILSCSNSKMGDELLAKYGDATSRLQPPLTFVPTIVFNNSYSRENQSMALRYFRELMCRLLDHDCSASSICQ